MCPGPRPVDRSDALGNQVFVASGEWPASKESIIRRERRRMSGFDNQMLRIGDHGFFPPRLTSPQDENERPVKACEHLDGGIRESLPADILM